MSDTRNKISLFEKAAREQRAEAPERQRQVRNLIFLRKKHWKNQLFFICSVPNLRPARASSSSRRTSNSRSSRGRNSRTEGENQEVEANRLLLKKFYVANRKLDCALY